MIERTEACFGIKPGWLAGDTAYGSAANLDWLVNQQGIAPHVPVIDKSQREDGTFSREEFIYDEMRDIYTCLAGKRLATTGHISTDHTLRYVGSVPECRRAGMFGQHFALSGQARASGWTATAALRGSRSTTRRTEPHLKLH
jgi:hypothetical protein